MAKLIIVSNRLPMTVTEKSGQLLMQESSGGLATSIGAWLVYRDHHQRQTHTQYCDRLLREVQAGEVTIAKLRELESIPAPVFAWLCEHDVITTAKQREGRD
jgi:hypothetical protein